MDKITIDRRLSMEKYIKSLIGEIYRGDIGVVKILLEIVTDVNIQDNDGGTALMHVSIMGHKEVVELLINKGANVNLQDNDGETALIHAVKYGHKEIVELLLKNGANVNILNKFGKTALMYAVKKKNKEILELLEEHIEQQKIGKTTHNREKLKEGIKLILEHGVDYSLVSLNGKATIVLDCYYGCKSCEVIRRTI